MGTVLGMAEGPEHVTLHLVTRRDATPWVDPWGREHRDTTEILETVEVHRSVDTVGYNNGYQDLTSSVYVADDGRRFHRYLTVDYHGNVHYTALEPADTPEGACWVHQLGRGTRWMRDGEPYAPWLSGDTSNRAVVRPRGVRHRR